MKVFELHGTTGSGKTTTVELLIKELVGRGYTVGTIKNIHFEGFAMDTAGTNTFRHRAAGAELVTARGCEETDVLFTRQLPMSEVLKFYSQDFVISEGHSEMILPKIIAAHTEAEIDERMTDETFAICGIISNRVGEYRNLPVINALENVSALADLAIHSVPNYTEILTGENPMLIEKKFFGKKNKVYLIQNVKKSVVKVFNSWAGRETELEIYKILRRNGVHAPTLISTSIDKEIELEFIEGATALERLEELEGPEKQVIQEKSGSPREPERVAGLSETNLAKKEQIKKVDLFLDGLCGWVFEFYRCMLLEKGERWILGDIHLRNFIFERESDQVFGMDFEECRPGLWEKDAARLCLFILSYSPAFTEFKKMTAAMAADKLFAGLSMDRDIFEKALISEMRSLEKRRGIKMEEDSVKEIFNV